jgi:hypothetical protein
MQGDRPGIKQVWEHTRRLVESRPPGRPITFRARCGDIVTVIHRLSTAPSWDRRSKTRAEMASAPFKLASKVESCHHFAADRGSFVYKRKSFRRAGAWPSERRANASIDSLELPTH